MKRNYIIYIALIFGFFSCDGLEIQPDSSVSNSSFWKTEADAEAALNGMYSRFRNDIPVHSWMYWYEARTGNIAPGLQSGGVGSYIDNNLTSNMNNANWQPFYKIVSSANSIIQYVPTIDFSNEVKKNEILAQAYFIRAYSYFNLTRIWGEVPIVTAFIDSDTHPQLYPSKSSVENVFELIKQDINQAEELYNSDRTTDNTRVSRAAILMLKAEIYLWLSKVHSEGDEALNVADSAIEEVLTFSYDLLDDYAMVFSDDYNNEIIFSIHHDLLENANQYGRLFGQSRSLVPNEYQNNPIPVGVSHTLQFSDLFYENYRNRTENDKRAEVISEDMELGSNNFRWTNKFMGELNGNVRAFTSNTLVYRFSEALLFKAEILAERSMVSESVEILNRVVARAYGNPSFYADNISVDELKTLILEERIIEFAGEAKSWFDLIRFGEVFNRVPSLSGRENDNEGNILYMPVHHSVFSTNPNIEQTPGFD